MNRIDSHFNNGLGWHAFPQGKHVNHPDADKHTCLRKRKHATLSDVPSSLILNQSGGFTLLELLASMSLMVVAAACLYSSLSTAFKTKQIAERNLNPLENAQAAMELMMQDLRGAAEPNGTLTGDFVGTDDRRGTNIDFDSLVFYSTNHQIGDDEDRITCGIGKIELLLEEPQLNVAAQKLQTVKTYNLVRRVTDNLLTEDEDDDAESFDEILCRHVRSLNFRYYDGESWQDEWDSSESYDIVPLAVEVTLELEPRSEDLPQHVSAQNRLSRDYLMSVTQVTQVLTLPCGVALADAEEAAEAEEEEASQSQSQGASGQTGTLDMGGGMMR